MYWFGFISVAALMAGFSFKVEGLGQVALMLLAFAAMVGVYTEMERYFKTAFSAGTVAVVSATVIGAVCGGAWLARTGVSISSYLHAQADEVVKELLAVYPNSGMTVDAVIGILPASLLVVFIFSLLAALVWERKAMLWFALPVQSVAQSKAQSKAQPERSGHDRLVRFRVPDYFVWLAVASALGCALHFANPWVGILASNSAIVLVVIYFLQGVSIMTSAFQVFRMGPVWRGFWYVMMFSQLFLMVSVIGFADYWLDFRQRLAKRQAQSNKGI